MSLVRRWLNAALLGAAAVGAAGCSTTRTVASDVQTFSSVAAIAPGAGYRFERLPSQEAQSVQQDQLEAIAQPALERAGLRRVAAADARYTVQVALDSRQSVRYDPWGPGPWGRGFYGRGLYGRGYGYGFGYGFGYGYGYGYGRDPFGPDRVDYQQQVSVVVRDTASGQVVYETRAAHDGWRPADTAVLAVMFDAALHGFPQAPPGIRRVEAVLPGP